MRESEEERSRKKEILGLLAKMYGYLLALKIAYQEANKKTAVSGWR